MKSQWILRTGSTVLITVSCFGLLPATRAANTTNSPSGTAKTNSEPAELAVPLAVFDVTVKPTKDPFFPLSTRQPVPQIVTNAAPSFDASSFTLKGIDWSENHRLALVNNRTLATGEDAEVMTPSGKIRVHLVEIKPTSVILRIASQLEPVEISLRKSVQ